MKTYLKSWEPHLIIYRPYLVSFAFRMTGSLAESEEIVQETFIECVEIDPQSIGNHKAWLTKVCSNKSIDHLRSAYKRRESYIGTWLPDAVPDGLKYWENLEESAPLEKSLILSESLTTTFLLMVESLTPEQRVVYILNEVFDYSFNEISEFLNKSVAALRKIAQRAREAISLQKIQYDSINPESQNLIVQFFEIVKNQDKNALMALLSEDSEFWSDGGGKISAIRVVVREREQIVRFFSSDMIRDIYNADYLKIETGFVNKLPGMMISKKDEQGNWIFDTIMSFETKNGKITRVYSQRNPDKLQNLAIDLFTS